MVGPKCTYIFQEETNIKAKTFNDLCIGKLHETM